MTAFQKQWREQCEAAEGILQNFGSEKALSYLVGEKFMNFLREVDWRPEFAAELPRFVAEVKEIFETQELRAYLDELQEKDAVKVKDDEKWVFGDFKDAEEEPRDVVEEVEKVLLIERARELLTGGE